MWCMPETSISLAPVCSHFSAKLSPTSVLCCCCQTARTANCDPKGSVVCNSDCKEHLLSVQVDGRLVTMAAKYSRTSSDTLKLRRLITSLKTSGSDLATKLKYQSAQIFSGVQIVRSNNPCISNQVAAILSSRLYNYSELFSGPIR